MIVKINELIISSVLLFATFSQPAAQTLSAQTAAQPATPTEDGNPRAEPTSTLGGLSVGETQQTISIQRGESTLLTYTKQSPPVPTGIDPIYARSGFLHPVNSPTGKTITATFPIDHAHQHGIFAAWVKTTYSDRQIDFWNLAERTGRVGHKRVNATFNHVAGTGFDVDLIYESTTEPIVEVLNENWKVVAYPTDGSFYCFDIESQQRALTDQPLVVEKYHYGGMALRGRMEWLHAEKLVGAAGGPKEVEPSDFLNDQGSGREQGNHQHTKWVSLHGEIDGKPASITVLSQADNFRAPQAARLHPTKPYFCFSPCVDGSFVIDRAHPLISRYRYLVTDAEPDPQWIEKQWQNWCGEQSIAPTKGTITFNGKPLVAANIAFYPELGGRPSYASTDEQGQFSLKLDEQTEAAKVGSGTFLISTSIYDETTQEWSEELLPKGATEEGFSYEISPGQNVVDFNLSAQ
ncbi:MAG: PmoA family protein [Pirellulaceae bacterium]|nr:PmoA family protein [Pirellulaceae bacterium]